MLGGGCFWCLEAVFEQLQGVERVVSGYAGGSTPNPTYEDVCSGETGHAEVVQVTFNPGVLSYRDILHVFFSIHDPTTLDRQGADIGTQYRSVIFVRMAEQKRVAEALVRELEQQRVWEDPIATQIEPAPTFYPAEEYHQQYFRRNPNHGYCLTVVGPKVAKFRTQWANRLRTEPLVREKAK